MKASPLVASPTLIDQTVAVARALQTRATALQTPAERRQQAELDRMLQTAADKVTLVQLTDQAFRCRAASRTAEHLTHILDVQGVPRFFSPLDHALLRGFQTFGGWLPTPISPPFARPQWLFQGPPAESKVLASSREFTMVLLVAGFSMVLAAKAPVHRPHRPIRQKNGALF